MSTITLLSTTIYEKESTSKYWRNIECQPQTVDLKTWGNNSPYFILQGIVIDSHDPKEIGQKKECHVQTYSFWLPKDKYQINYTNEN